jgi:molybdopterin-guanine dinucleotide biosynthesis protein A
VEAQAFGAVVLSGGEAVRLGGADKTSIEVGGRTLLEHVLAALVDATEVVVVGDEVPVSRPVTFTREDPVSGGPAAALLAGLRRFARMPALVVVLAVDMPLVTSDTVRRLVEFVRDDGATLVDPTGRVQYLCAAYSVAALERARAEAGEDSGHGLPMHRLVSGLRLAEVPDAGDEAHDLDTWDDLVELRARLDEREQGSPEVEPG